MAKKVVKKSAKKVVKTTENNIAKIAKTAKKVNAQVQEAAQYVANDIMENGQAIRDTAVKAAEKITLSDSVKKIKATAIKINTEVTDTTVEVTDAMVKTGKKLTKTATEQVKAAIENIDIKAGFNKIGEVAKKVNTYSLETAEEIIEATEKGSVTWNKLMKKAIKGGLKFSEKNQELVFDTLEVVKKQVTKNAYRATDILTKN
ncbi:MAG: hypothetical protein ACI85O_002685 [Saprospiraceae bacterium]|jgi:hypothetical protein